MKMTQKWRNPKNLWLSQKKIGKKNMQKFKKSKLGQENAKNLKTKHTE